MSTNRYLARIKPNGTVTFIDNTFQSISDGVGASFDFVSDGEKIGFYIDDEGLLNGSRFNAVASMLAGRALYGNCVLCHGLPDDEGNTLPPSDEIIHFAQSISHLWRAVVANAEQVGQDVMPKSNEATVPSPTITGFDNLDDFFKAIGLDD